jgi:hypothetical protein
VKVPPPVNAAALAANPTKVLRASSSRDWPIKVGLRGAALAIALAAFSPAPALCPQHESNSLPAYIADERVLVGKYHFDEEGFTVDVSLNADKTALYSIGMGAEEGGFRAEGFWTLSDGIIHIHNRPGPVRLERAGAPTTDPTVALSVTAKLPDGSPAEGLGVSWPGSPGFMYMSDGRHDTRRQEGPITGEVTISRSGDRKPLASFVKKADGPNAYSITYYPSDVEPFDLSAMALDPKADVIEVEVGTASAKLARVR